MLQERKKYRRYFDETAEAIKVRYSTLADSSVASTYEKVPSFSKKMP